MTVGIWVLGVAMTNFGRFPDRDDVDLAFEACSGALADADIAMSQVEILAAGSTMNRTGIGQEVQKQLGQYGIPVYNVTNACATGATALRTVCVALAAGEAEVGLAVGAEQMGKKGLLGMTSRWPDTYTAQGRSGAVAATEGVLGTNLMPALFSHAAMDYVRRYPNTGEEVFAEIAEKNHANSVNNPFAMYQKAYTLDEILASPVVTSPNTVLMCGPTCDGAAAAVVVTDDFLRRLGPAARARAVRIAASILTSDPWSEGSEVVPDLNTLSALAAKRAYLQAGVGPGDLDLVELHDCFATAELLHYENLQLCGPGEAADFFHSGATRRDGRIPVNPSGGLVSKGHPLGATGLANIFEVTTHLRGEAGDRQIDGARRGMTHVVGLGSSCAVHILDRPTDA
ncbi:thiolase family protein [Nocardia sp. NBC_01377]|uniref:thiolase C-terminal domain-containing protein n=1 Tax=Nocardia sp. NBC_01377 TaxID=2903595 RepID=UPI003244055F